MPISPQSIENFRRGIEGDSFYGVFTHKDDILTIYLALGVRSDGQVIDNTRLSIINDQVRQPLMGSGGHSTLASWAGLPVRQLLPGLARGEAFGFSIIKTGVSSLKIGTYRSGFNVQYSGERPLFAPMGHPHYPRTLLLSEIEPLNKELRVLGALETYQPGLENQESM